MTTEVFQIATGNQFAVYVDTTRALAVSMVMGEEFDTRVGPDLIGLPLGLVSTRFLECDRGRRYENLRQFRVLDDQPFLMVKHIGSEAVFYKSVDDFRC